MPSFSLLIIVVLKPPLSIQNFAAFEAAATTELSSTPLEAQIVFRRLGNSEQFRKAYKIGNGIFRKFVVKLLQISIFVPVLV
jgi:hypothetical protein